MFLIGFVFNVLVFFVVNYFFSKEEVALIGFSHRLGDYTKNSDCL